jgi:hypothetical protein
VEPVEWTGFRLCECRKNDGDQRHCRQSKELQSSHHDVGLAMIFYKTVVATMKSLAHEVDSVTSTRQGVVVQGEMRKLGA